MSGLLPKRRNPLSWLALASGEVLGRFPKTPGFALALTPPLLFLFDLLGVVFFTWEGGFVMWSMCMYECMYACMYVYMYVKSGWMVMQCIPYDIFPFSSLFFSSSPFLLGIWGFCFGLRRCGVPYRAAVPFWDGNPLTREERHATERERERERERRGRWRNDLPCYMVVHGNFRIPLSSPFAIHVLMIIS